MIIGDEILGGKRSDAHLPHAIERLGRLGLTIAWARILSDDRALLVESFRQILAQPLPVFCFGGIGATPDDHTRQAAAEAAGQPLIRHPEAVAEIEAQFGAAAYPNRILMAELPEGAGIIPNAYNRIPAFHLDRCFFLPGFPELAWPMLDWVLEHRLQVAALEPVEERAVRVEETGESLLVPLLRELTGAFPELTFFSLPQLGATLSSEVGVKGRRGVDAGFAALTARLDAAAIPWRPLESFPAAAPASGSATPDRTAS